MPPSLIHIGTSGWSYASWRGHFYPREVMLKHHLNYYVTQFDTAELNSVFYRTPSIETVRNWQRNSPDGFIFAWKASRFITHWKRLSHKSHNSLALINQRLRILGKKAGPVLFQLPANFERNDERLEIFLRMLLRQRQYAFEFRHDSWYCNDVIKLLEKYNISLCLSDHHDAPAPWIATAQHVYVRGHGPNGHYKGRYSNSALSRWAAHIKKWQRQKRSVYVYFDNDQKSAAPEDARRLLDEIS